MSIPRVSPSCQGSLTRSVTCAYDNEQGARISAPAPAVISMFGRDVPTIVWVG